jgi:hypothetical protein
LEKRKSPRLRILAKHLCGRAPAAPTPMDGLDGRERKKGAKTRSWSHQIYIIEKRKEKEKR